MELKVIGKRLFTERIDKTITEGEYNADVIGITLDRYHDGADLSEYSFRITAYSEDGEAMAEQVLSKDPADEKYIRLVWTVTPDFAAESGLLTLTLAGVAPDNSAQIKFTSSPVRINADGRAEFIPEKTVAEQYLNQVQLEVQKALDAAERAEEAASQTFEVPVAEEETIGGILSGGDVSVDESGNVTVNSVGGKKVEADVPADAKFTDTVYTLPKASESVLGGVMADGTTVTVDSSGVLSAIGGTGEKYVLPAATENTLGGVMVDGTTVTVENGVISAAAGEKYVLPAATATVLGGVKVDGTTITAKDGVISAVGGSGGGNSDSGYVLPAATDSSLGGVIVDGTTITANENGIISVIGGTGGNSGGNDYVLPAATENVLGGVMVDGSTISASGGVISVEDNSHSHTVENITGLQDALDGKADISAIPASLPADGGNADTVGGFTVAANVPADAQFTDTVYTLPQATTSVLGGVKTDGSTISANDGIISVADNSHGHTIANVTGLQTALDGKADLSAIPASLPANGGNAATVGGFTVGANVPAGAQFTDTVYTLPTATTSTLGGVMVDGTTITANASGVISALASSGSGITIDNIYEENIYWNTSITRQHYRYIKLPYAYTHWNYLFINCLFNDQQDNPLQPWIGAVGSFLINTNSIIAASRNPSTGVADRTNLMYSVDTKAAHPGDTYGSWVSFPNTTHILIKGLEQLIIWGITIPSKPMLGTLVSSATA